VKVVYGNPKTIMTIGMSLIGDVPTPFIGFVDKDKAKVEGDNFFTAGPSSTALIDKIDALGGVIIYIENPDAAERLSNHMMHLFEAAIESTWGDIEQAETELQ
jgi:hypothetical protein